MATSSKSSQQGDTTRVEELERMLSAEKDSAVKAATVFADRVGELEGQLAAAREATAAADARHADVLATAQQLTQRVLALEKELGDRNAMATATAERAARSVPAIKVRSCSPHEPFRRAGLAFSREARTIPLADLTADQISRIRKEPLLVVEEVELEGPADGDVVT